MRYSFIHRLWAWFGVEKSIKSDTLLTWKGTKMMRGPFSTLSNGRGKEELWLYHLERHKLCDYLPHAIQSSWLAFYLGEKGNTQEACFLGLSKEAFFMLYDNDNSSTTRDLKEQESGLLLLLIPSFLSEKTRMQIRAFQMSLSVQQEPFTVTFKQQKELHCILNKIGSLMECEYVFRKDYIRELIIQLIHFLLKSSGSCELQPEENIS